ncbi:MAG: hypothetical protein WKG01_07140 [Kofleriaceae bacterium]
METYRALEAALAASSDRGSGHRFDRDTLAVYADELMSIGDPRGELIALDLQLETQADRTSRTRRYRFAPAELVARRAALLETWLRALVPSDPTRGWIGDHVRFGFLEDLELASAEQCAQLPVILASPLGELIRGVTIRGVDRDLATALDLLAGISHPWLARLSLHNHGSGRLLSPALEARVIAATPRLARLELAGHRAIRTFAHPALRELRIDGRASLGCLASGAFVGVTLLDLGFAVEPAGYGYGWTRDPDTEDRDLVDEDADLGHEGSAPIDDDAVATVAALLHGELLPAVRQLDLSRNEPGFAGTADDDRDDDDGENGERARYDRAPSARLDPFALIGIAPLHRQLTHLRLPAMRTELDFTRLSDAVAAMPALVEVEVVRGHYYRAPALPHASARFVRPPAWPWPPPASIRPGETLRIAVPGSRSGDLVGLADAVAGMERWFEDLPADARYAWTRLWLFVNALALDREAAFPADVLVEALEACASPGSWRELRDELRARRPLPASATVAVRRTIG